MKNKPKPASRPKKHPKSTLNKAPSVKAALSGKKKKSEEKTGKNKIGTLDNANLKKMERKLRETKERLLLLSEVAEEGIAVHDNGVIIDANDALARIFGYELSEMIGMKAERFTTPESWKVIQKHISTEYNKPYNGVGVRKDGSTFICSLIGKSYKYKGRTLRVSIFHDITDRKVAEFQRDAALEELRKSENRLRAQYNGNPIPTFTWQKKGDEFILTDINDNAKTIIGRQGKTFLGRQASEMYKSRQDILRTLQICFDEKRIIRIESRSEHFMPGKFVVITFVFVPPDLIMVHMEDITERKQAEESLKETELKFRTIFDSASDGILLAQSSNGKFFSANETICAMLGYTKKEILKLGVADIHPEKSIPYVNDLFDKLLKKEISLAQNVPILKKDKTVFFADINASQITLDEKEYLIGIFRDITERKQAEEELKKYRDHLEELVRERTIKLESSNKELEAFSYSASHDLRAPLRIIDGFSETLLEDYEDKLDIQGKDYLIRIRTAVKRMAELIEDLLQLSRITRTEINIEKINLTRIARFVIDELQKSQPQRQVEIRIAEDLEETADSKLMRIVLENLLGNAWKFTGKQAQAVIEFGLTNENNKKVYFIRDNGVGFDMAYADKLFAPFQRLHAEDEFPGTGIGLATVRRIIHRHGGRVWAEGEKDKGATFYFSLNEK
jgi:PAS domain S-box-containing protein